MECRDKRGEDNVCVVKETVCRKRPASEKNRAWNDNKNMYDMREDLHSSGKCPELAGLLPGVQGEVPAGGDHHKKVPKMREDLYLSV